LAEVQDRVDDPPEVMVEGLNDAVHEDGPSWAEPVRLIVVVVPETPPVFEVIRRVVL
jgi:hypothetical protein